MAGEYRSGRKGRQVKEGPSTGSMGQAGISQGRRESPTVITSQWGKMHLPQVGNRRGQARCKGHRQNTGLLPESVGRQGEEKGRQRKHNVGCRRPGRQNLVTARQAGSSVYKAACMAGKGQRRSRIAKGNPRVEYSPNLGTGNGANLGGEGEDTQRGRCSRMQKEGELQHPHRYRTTQNEKGR